MEPMEGATTREPSGAPPARLGSSRTKAFKRLDPLDVERELGGHDVPIPLGPADRGVFRTGRLPNGLRYFIRKNEYPAKRCSLALAVNTGSVYESEKERGVAHILEHLAFRGKFFSLKHQGPLASTPLLTLYLSLFSCRYGELRQVRNCELSGGDWCGLWGRPERLHIVRRDRVRALCALRQAE